MNESKYLEMFLLNVTKVMNIDINRTDDYTENGLSSRPYKTIQAAIDAAASGTLLDIVPGIYPEDITLKPGVYLKSRLGLQPGVMITGKVSWPSGAGTILTNGIYVLNDSDHALDFGGSGVQKLRAYNSKFETNSNGAHHAIKHSNTNVGSEIILHNSLAQVQDSSGGARAIETLGTSQGTIGMDNTTVRLVDDIDAIAINLKGAIAYWQRMDEIRGRVIVSDLASCNISLDGMYTNTLSCLETNSAGLSILSSAVLSSTASPIVTGAGAFAFSHIGYSSTGQGLAGTLNGGAGAAIGAIPAESADGIIYDPTISGMTATRVKTAFDEIVNDYQKESEKDHANGYAGLGADTKINSAQLPAIAITDTYTVASEVEQLALTVQKGDVAVRSDENKSYINTTGNNVSMADWQLLLTPTDAVLSVDTRTGAVTLNDLYEAKDLTIIKEGENVSLLTNDSNFQTDAEVDADILVHKNLPSAHHEKTTELEGTVIKSTGEAGGTKVLTEKGDGTSSWQEPTGGKTHSPWILNVFRTSGVIFPNNDTGFCLIGGAGAITNTEALAQVRTPKGRVKAIQGYCSGGSGDFTVHKNGVVTTLTGTVNAVGQFYLTGEGTVEFADSDLISLYYDSGVNWTIHGIQVVFETELI